MLILILGYSLHIIYSDTEIRVIKQNITCVVVGERSRLFMFNKKDEIGKKWRPASSPFKALFHCAEKEEIAHRKLQKTRRAYIKERTKQQEHLNGEIAGLDKLLNEGDI